MEQNRDRNAKAQLEFLNRTVPIELNAEIVLPDYKSEISRLLWVRPIFSAPVRFIGGGKADLSGSVRYQVLYVGPDRQLYSTEWEDRYTFSVPFDTAGYDVAGGTELSVELMPENATGRVLAPRKLALRCRLHARVRGYADRHLGCRLTDVDEARVLRLCGMCECGRIYTAVGEPVELCDEIALDGQGEVRVILAEGSVFLPEASAGEGNVRCRGEVIVKLLCCNEGEEQGEPFTAVRRIPFEESVAMEGVSPECGAFATGYLGELRTSVEEGRIALSTEMTLAATAQGSAPVYYTKDVFAPGMSAECRSVREDLRQPQGCFLKHVSTSGDLSLAEAGIPEGATVTDVTAQARLDEPKHENGKTLLSGELDCRVLYRVGDEYAVASVHLPCRVALEADFGQTCVLALVPMCRARMERERLFVDAELQLCLRAEKLMTVEAISEARFSEAPKPRRADVELFYPTVGDTLWSVGKRYGVSPAGIALANGIHDDDLDSAAAFSDVRCLLIP